jgi:hypothetical protein
MGWSGWTLRTRACWAGQGLYDREQIRAGRRTAGDVLAARLGRLVAADWAEAVERNFVFEMPRLAAV